MAQYSRYLSIDDLESIAEWIDELESKVRVKDESKLDLDYDVAGKGRHRIVFDLDHGLILKVAITLDGIRHIKNESEIYRNVPLSLECHLAAIKESGYGWIIMKKLTRAVPRNTEYWVKVRKLQLKFKKYGIQPYDLFTNGNKVHWSNMRLDEKGRIVVVDYGHFRW